MVITFKKSKPFEKVTTYLKRKLTTYWISYNPLDRHNSLEKSQLIEKWHFLEVTTLSKVASHWKNHNSLEMHNSLEKSKLGEKSQTFKKSHNLIKKVKTHWKSHKIIPSQQVQYLCEYP